MYILVLISTNTAATNDQPQSTPNKSVAESSAEQLLFTNPGLKDLFNQLLYERINQAKKQGKFSGSTLVSTFNPNSNGKQKGTGKFINNIGKSNRQVTRAMLSNNQLKSPSDTTVYAPALRCVNDATSIEQANKNLHELLLNQAEKLTPEKVVDAAVALHLQKDNIVSRISDFVESIRGECEQLQRQNNSQESPLAGKTNQNRTLEVTFAGLEQAKQKADNAIIEAEKFVQQ